MLPDSVICVGILAVSLAIYLQVMHPSVADADNAELILCTKLFVNPHPPGYPLLLILGKAWLKLSEYFDAFGSDPIRALNTFNVVISSATVGAVFVLSRLLGNSKGASIAAGFLFGFAPHLRTYATQYEVFSLNHFIIALLLISACKFDAACSKANDAASNKKRVLWLRVGCFLAGVGMSNQHTSILFTLPMVVWVLYRWPGAIRHALSCAAIIGLGLTPYLALLVTMKNDSWLFAGWGLTDSWDGFRSHFLRSDYGTFSLVAPEEGMTAIDRSANWQLYAQEVQSQTLGYLWVAAVVGLWLVVLPTRGSRKEGPSRSLWVLMAVMFVVYLVFMNQLSNLNVSSAPTLRDVMRRFYFQPHILMVAAVASGLTAFTGSLLPAHGGRFRLHFAVDLLLGLFIAYMQVTLHWEDHSQSYVMENFGRAVLDGMPQDAYLFVHGDILKSAGVLAYAKEDRMDLTIVASNFIFAPFFAEVMQRSKNITLPGLALGFNPGYFTTKDLLDTLIVKHGKRVFYVGSRFTIEEDTSYVDDYAVRLSGIANELVSRAEYMKISDALFSVEPHRNANIDWKGKAAAMEPYVSELYRSLPISLPRYFNLTYHNESWEYEVLRNFKVALTSNAEQLLVLAAFDDLEAPDVQLPEAVGELVSTNQTARLWQWSKHGTPKSYDVELPHRYRMLIFARALLQQNRAATPLHEEAMKVPQFMSEVMMLTAMQQILRFHMCPTVHGPLFEETASLVAMLITASKGLGMPADAEEFSRSEALQYIRSMKKFTTRKHPQCGH